MDHTQPPQTKSQILFIAGCDRSGTTALVNLLNSHPSCCIGMERFKKYVHSANKKLYPHIFEKRYFFDIKEEQTNIQWAKYYQNLQQKFDTASVIGDKVPRYFEIFPQLNRNFPNSIFLFLLRDPYAVANSWKKRALDTNDHNWPVHNGAQKAVSVWNKSLVAAYKAHRSKAYRFVFVSYERIFSGDLDYAQTILRAIGLPQEDQFDHNYFSMTKDWRLRAQSRSLLTQEEETYVSEKANIRLFSYIKTKFATEDAIINSVSVQSRTAPHSPE